MKCRSMVKFVPARRQGSGKPYQKAVKWFPLYYIKSGRFTPEPGMVECDGDIKVSIKADTEGECACSSYATLNIEFKCNKCGNTLFTELPGTQEELSELVQRFFRELGELERESLIQTKLDKELERQKQIEEMHKQSKARMEKFEKSLKGRKR